MIESAEYVRWFGKVGSNHVPQVGGKNASLVEMFAKLKDKGIEMPEGFATNSALGSRS